MKDLSLRLKAIAALVPYGARACDIGTDHGYLPIYLKLNNIAKTVIAADLNQKPLETARQNFKKFNISDIELRLCDGLSGINKDEVDTVIIAGMGGNVISNILHNSAWAKSYGHTFILQPTTSAETLREFLCSNGFEIQSETVILENQKLYSIMLVHFTNQKEKFSDGYYYIGKVDKTTENGLKYIKKQEKRLYSAAKALENIEAEQENYNKFISAYNDIKNHLMR